MCTSSSSNFTGIFSNATGHLSISNSILDLSGLSLGAASTDTLNSDSIAGTLTISSEATLSNTTGNDFSKLEVNGLVAVGDPSAVIDLTNNHWGTTVDSLIVAKILDHLKDANRPTVRYQPSSIPLLKRSPAATPNEAYVAAAYEDLLQRPADPAGLSYWSNLLDQGTPRSTVAQALAHSAEYDATIIQSAYQRLLGRTADAGGLAFWVDQMQHGLTDEHLEASFLGSAESYARAGGTDRGWVDALYQGLLGRSADRDGEGYWVQQLAAGADRSGIALAIASSSERESQRVQQDYQAFLNRSASADEVAGWVGRFARGVANEDIMAGFVASDEYFREHTS